MANQPIPFHTRWDDVPICVIDFETTGVRPGVDRAVQTGLARFEHGKLVGSIESLLAPGMFIPEAATTIHGITDAMVIGAPTPETFFAGEHAQALLKDAQPAAFNSGFDRLFMPPGALADYAWPWICPLTMARAVDRYAKGAGRHKLLAVCERHGVLLTKAHSAEADAIAAGELIYKLVPKLDIGEPSIGALLEWTRVTEAREWARFHGWLAKQPPRQEEATAQ